MDENGICLFWKVTTIAYWRSGALTHDDSGRIYSTKKIPKIQSSKWNQFQQKMPQIFCHEIDATCLQREALLHVAFWHSGLSICNALVCKTCLDDMASKHLGCSSNSSTTIPKLFVIVSRNPGDSLSRFFRVFSQWSKTPAWHSTLVGWLMGILLNILL